MTQVWAWATDGHKVFNLDHTESNPPASVEPIPPAFEPASTVLSASARLAVLDALPVAVFLIDDRANIRFANQRTAEMIGLDRTETFGRNVLDFVMVDDLDFAAELLNAGSGYAGETMGPSRVRYVDAEGVSHWSQVWAGTAPPEFGIDGFIVTLTEESVRDVLASAVNSVALDVDLDHMLAPVALSARAMPICGRGAILVVQPASGDDDDRFRAVGTWPLDDRAINASGTPWHQALSNGTDVDIDDVAVAGVAPAARDQLLDMGVKAMFVRVIRDRADAVVGVFVVFREHTGAASANQADHLNDAVRHASLAFAQSNRRLELEAAAHRDVPTAVAN